MNEKGTNVYYTAEVCFGWNITSKLSDLAQETCLKGKQIKFHNGINKYGRILLTYFIMPMIYAIILKFYKMLNMQ